jgi:hypothetical protein
VPWPLWRRRRFAPIRVAAEALEPEAGLLADADPIGFAEALSELGAALARNPGGVGAVALRAATDAGLRAAATVLRALGVAIDGPVASDRRDRRFADEA